MQLAHHGALAVDFTMVISGASKFLILSVYIYAGKVTVLGRCVCLFVCLHLIEYVHGCQFVSATTQGKRLEQLQLDAVKWLYRLM